MTSFDALQMLFITLFGGLSIVISLLTFRMTWVIRRQTNSLIEKAEDRAAIIGTVKLEAIRAKALEQVTAIPTLEPVIEAKRP